MNRLPGWVANLSRSFDKAGLEDVVETRQRKPKWELPNFHDTIMLGFEEVSLHISNGEAIREMIQQAASEMEENGRGVAITAHSVTVVGRKKPTAWSKKSWFSTCDGNLSPKAWDM